MFLLFDFVYSDHPGLEAFHDQVDLGVVLDVGLAGGGFARCRGFQPVGDGATGPFGEQTSEFTPVEFQEVAEQVHLFGGRGQDQFLS